MNKEKFIKINLLLFEILSILTILHVLGYLLYYSLFLRFVTTNDPNSMIRASLNFTHSLYQNNLYDIKFIISEIKFEEFNPTLRFNSKKELELNSVSYAYNATSIYENTTHQGFIILSKRYFEMENSQKTNEFSSDFKIFENKDDRYLSIVKEKGIENCFIFLDGHLAEEALNILFEMNNLMYDNWNTIIFFVIILFFFFMKINITYELIKTLNKFKFENFPSFFQIKNFYAYFIFNFTLTFIIPLLYFGYDDYKFDFCLGFSEAYFNSFLADRQILLKNQIDYFDPFQRTTQVDTDPNTNYKNLFFLVHDANRNTNNSITRLGYLKNMLFLCVFVWLSGMRNIFKAYNSSSVIINESNTNDSGNLVNEAKDNITTDFEQKNYISDNSNEKASKRKKCLRFTKNTILFCIFSLYLIFGIMNFYDIYKLLFLQLSNNIKFLSSFSSLYKVLSLMAYTYFYLFYVITSIYHNYKMFKQNHLKKHDIKYLEIIDDESKILGDLEKIDEMNEKQENHCKLNRDQQETIHYSFDDLNDETIKDKKMNENISDRESDFKDNDDFQEINFKKGKIEKKPNKSSWIKSNEFKKILKNNKSSFQNIIDSEEFNEIDSESFKNLPMNECVENITK